MRENGLGAVPARADRTFSEVFSPPVGKAMELPYFGTIDIKPDDVWFPFQGEDMEIVGQAGF